MKVLAIACLVISMISAPVSIKTSNKAVECDWPMFGRTSTRNRTIVSHSSLEPKKLTKVWELKYKINNSMVIVSDGLLFESNNEKLNCRKVDDGSIVWSFNAFSLKPDYKFIVVEHSLLAYKGVIFFYAYSYTPEGRRIVCLDKYTGELVNSYKLHIKDMYWHSLVYDGKLYYSDIEKLYCLDTNSWRILWTYPDKTHHSPIIHDGCLFILGISCLDALTGEFVWGKIILHKLSIAYSNGSLLTETSISTKTDIFCISAITGQVIWKSTIKEMEKFFFPYHIEISSIDNGIFFFFAKQMEMVDIPNEVFAFHIESKRVLWSLALGKGTICELTHIGDHLITGTNAGKILFIDENTGQIKHEIDLGEPIIREIVVSCDKMVVSTEKGIYCYSF